MAVICVGDVAVAAETPVNWMLSTYQPMPVLVCGYQLLPACSAKRQRTSMVRLANAANDTRFVLKPDSPKSEVLPVCCPACSNTVVQLPPSSTDTSTSARCAGDDRPSRLENCSVDAALAARG